MTLRHQMDYPHYPSQLTFGDFLPANAWLKSVELSVPPGVGWLYVRSMSHCVKYLCKSSFNVSTSVRYGLSA